MTEMMKRGGKKRKGRRSTMSQSVKVNVHVGDTVRLRPDSELPRVNSRANPGEFRRLAGPGNMYAQIPQPLASGSYGVAPSSAVPMTHPYFVAGGNRQQQDKRDDVLQVVNPSGITPDLTPSMRMIPSSNKNAMPLVNAPVLSKLPFQGDIPRINDMYTPQERAIASQPSAGGIQANQLSTPSSPPSILGADESSMEPEPEPESEPETAAVSEAPMQEVEAPGEIKQEIRKMMITKEELEKLPYRRKDKNDNRVFLTDVANMYSIVLPRMIVGNKGRVVAYLVEKIQKKTPVLRRGGMLSAF
jgi:hypothetical protein